MYDGYEHVDEVVQFEYPDEPDFGSSSEYVVIGYFSFFAGVI